MNGISKKLLLVAIEAIAVYFAALGISSLLVNLQRSMESVSPGEMAGAINGAHLYFIVLSGAYFTYLLIRLIDDGIQCIGSKHSLKRRFLDSLWYPSVMLIYRFFVMTVAVNLIEWLGAASLYTNLLDTSTASSLTVGFIFVFIGLFVVMLVQVKILGIRVFPENRQLRTS